MVGLKAVFFATLFFASGGFAHQGFSASSSPHGHSKKLDIAFEVDGGESWCNSSVKVSLTANRQDSFTKNNQEFQQMIGRIRGVLQSDCSKIRVIGFYSYVNGQPFDVVGESSKLTNWVYVPFKTPDAQDPCRGPDNPAVCKARWVAFNFARNIFGHNGFDAIELTRYLTTLPGASAEFKDKTASGRIEIYDANALPVSSSSEFADSQTDSMSEGCEDAVRTYPESNVEGYLSYRGIACNSNGKPFTQHLIVMRQDNEFKIVTVSGFKNEADSRKLAMAIFRTLAPETTQRAYGAISLTQQPIIDNACGIPVKNALIETGRHDPPKIFTPEQNNDGWEYNYLKEAKEPLMAMCFRTLSESDLFRVPLPAGLDRCVSKGGKLSCWSTVPVTQN